MNRSMFLLTLLLIGCSQAQPGVDSNASAPAVAVAPQQPDVTPPAAKEEPPAPSSSFAFTSDLTGQALPRVVAPTAPAPPPTERVGTAPKTRRAPAKVIDPDTMTRANYIPPPVSDPKPVATKPAAPPETIPTNLGAGADGVPVKPVLPVAAVATERAPDVNQPPALPTLGRPVSDRVSLDDPTGDASNAVIVTSPAKVPLAASGFLKVAVPDPFELGAQVKPKVPPTAEPAVAPVPVNPQRVK